MNIELTRRELEKFAADCIQLGADDGLEDDFVEMQARERVSELINRKGNPNFTSETSNAGKE